MDLRTKAIQGVGWSAVRNWGSRLITFLVYAVLARALSQSAIGLVALAGTYIAFVRVFVNQGFAEAIIQREEVEDAHLDTAFWTNLALAGLAMALSMALAPQIARLFGEPELAPIIQWLSPSFVLAALQGVQQSIFERGLDYRTLAIREFAAAVVGGAVGISMAVTGQGVWSLVGLFLAERITAVIVLWTASDWAPGLRVSRRHFTDLFRFGINILGTNLLYYVNSRADTLIIGAVLGPAALGLYDVAYKLYQSALDLITLTISSVAFSTFSRMQNNLDRMRNAFYTATQTVAVIAFPAFLGGMAIAPELVEVLFGDTWIPQSATVFQVLAVIGILHSVFYFNSGIIMACDKPQWRLGVSVMNAIGNLVAFTIAVPYGIVAVAAAYVIRGFVLAPVELILIRRLIDLDIRSYLRCLATPLGCALAMGAAVWGMAQGLDGMGALAVRVPLLTLGGALVYTALLWTFGRDLFHRVLDMLQIAIPGQ